MHQAEGWETWDSGEIIFSLCVELYSFSGNFPQNHKPSRNLTEISEISKVWKFVLFQRSPTTYWFLHKETGVEQSSIDENLCGPRYSLVQWESGEGGDIWSKYSSVRHGIVKKACFRWEHCMLHLVHENLVTEFENQMNYCLCQCNQKVINQWVAEIFSHCTQEGHHMRGWQPLPWSEVVYTIPNASL